MRTRLASLSSQAMLSLPLNISRHFLAWDRPWIEQVTGWLARGWEGRSALDLSRTLAIVPTQQAGRRLREALAAFAAEKGAAVFAPRVLTPEALLKQDLGSDVATSLQSLLAWAEVLRTVDLDDFRALFPVDPPERNFAWSLRLAQQFVRLQVTLADSGYDPNKVVASAGEDFVERERWERIAELARVHRTHLEARNLQEPQLRRVTSASRPSLEKDFRRVVVLAVTDLSPLAASRLSHAAESVPIDVLVFAPESEDGGFDLWGRPLPQAWEQREIDLEDFDGRVHLCADPAEQAARVGRWVRHYAREPGAFAVGVADPEITPRLENELVRAGQPVFNPEGRFLRRDGLFVLLTCMVELAANPTFAAVEALARCPDFIGCLQRRSAGKFSAARWLEALDDLHALHLPADLALARAFAGRGNFAAELTTGLELMETLRSTMHSGSPAVGGAQAFQTIFSGRHMDRNSDADGRFEAAASQLMTLWRECRDVEPQFDRLAPSDWWEVSLRLLGDQRIAEEKPAAALELQGWLELLWEDAPHLVVAGMNDGHVPEAVPDDFFLPGSLRQRLGLTTNASRFARDAYLLQAIAASRRKAGRLDLLLGKTAASGDPLRPSRLLLRCADDKLPARIEFLFRSIESADATATWTRAWKLKPPRLPPPRRVAVTSLRRYLACPFRFYLRHVMAAESVDPWKSELDAFDFGTLCHGALEQIGRDPLLRDCTDAGLLRDALWRDFDAAVRTRFGDLLSLPLTVQVESARQRLSKLAELQARERAEGWVIIEVERAFEIEVAGLAVRGKIDRIDRHDVSGLVRVLDYKTSDTPVTPAAAHLRRVRPGETTPAWALLEGAGPRQAWSDLQLPLYLRAVGAEFGGRVTGGYFNLPKAAGETMLALWEDYSLGLHESALRCAEGACAAINRGEFWPPSESIRAERDECAALFHQGVAASVEWQNG